MSAGANDPVHPNNERIWVSDDRKTFVRMWPNGTVEVVTRENSYEVWGPPITLTEEKT